VIKMPKTTGGTGRLKWQCNTDCHFFPVLIVTNIIIISSQLALYTSDYVKIAVGYNRGNTVQPITKCHMYIAVSSLMTDNRRRAVRVKYHGVSGYYVCSTGWTSVISDSACQSLGYASVYIAHLHSTHTRYSHSHFRSQV